MHKNCPVTLTWRILGRPWRLVLVDRLLDGPKTFNQLLESMPGISSRTLSKILKELQKIGIIEKIPAGDEKRYLYTLTPMGRDLENLVRETKRWADKWLMINSH
jgi:DNA-binding HxlR family transcriptional regulator